jgi:hypothetical protein
LGVLPAVFGLPEWLVLGLVLGFLASLGVAAVFYVGMRLFPAVRPTGPSWNGDARRHTEIRAYLQAIGEPYAEHAEVAGFTVSFYLPQRDVAITFDPRAFYAIEATDTRAVLVEHEMPGIHLGARLPFETPELTITVPRSTDPTAAAFARLGLPPSASIEEVKDAYRERIKEVHPDHGGSVTAFREIQEAYATASRHATAT